MSCYLKTILKSFRYFEIFILEAFFDQFWSSTALALRFLAVSLFLAPTCPPAHFGDLELTGTKKSFPYRQMIFKSTNTNHLELLRELSRKTRKYFPTERKYC